MSTFEGEALTRWLPKREMQLLENFVFIDSKGVRWLAPINSIVDGSSIPRLFWTVIGSPFVGKHRRASIIHDVYCQTKTTPHKQVHKMFYEAMRCDGVNYFKAKVMYFAVKLGGPKW